MYRVVMFSTDPKSLNASLVYQETETVYSCVFTTEDLSTIDDCFKVETYDQGIDFAQKFPQYNSTLVKEEFITAVANNNPPKVKLHTISPNYTWQDVDALYNLLLVTWFDACKRQTVMNSSSPFMFHLMQEAYGNKRLFEAYTMIIPAKEIHKYLLSPQDYIYVAPKKEDITGRMNYAYTLLKKTTASYMDVIHINRALTEVQYILYPPVDSIFFTGMPVHRTLSQKEYLKIADWMLALYFIKDEERRKKRYDSVVDEKTSLLIMFYLQSFYNDLTLYGDFPKCFRFPNDLAVPTSNADMHHIKTYLFACSKSKKEMEGFVKRNKLACTIKSKVGMFVIDEPIYEKIYGTPQKTIEDCVSKTVSNNSGVYWTTYKK